MSDVADKLREAKALIERGWTRHMAERDGRYCAVGAVVHVTPPIREMERRQRRECFSALKLATGRLTVGGVASWNDQQRSKGPVLAAFDKAIELAEQSA